MRPPVTTAGRLLRSGAASVSESGSAALRDAQLSLRNMATALRQQLDAVAADPLATPKEKRSDSKKAIASAKVAWNGCCAKVAQARATLQAQVERARDLVNAYEAKLTPLAVARIQRKAEQLRQAKPEVLLDALRDGEARKDADLLMAASLAGDPNAALRAFHRMARPEAFEQLTGDLAAFRQLSEAAGRMAQGLDELDAQDDAHAIDGASGGDLLGTANTPPSKAPIDPTWPGWIEP
jgi:hypothetical protein